MTKCFDAGLPVVVGTTGWYDKTEEVKKLCNEKKACLFYASNFSIGVNLFFKLNEQLAAMMNRYDDYNVSVEEIHHIHKLDAPSGTAISIANQITGHLNRKTKFVNTTSNKPEELEIISKREGEVPGTHSVKYYSAIDDIEIKHTAHNRKGFALGAVMAAEFVKGKKGVYGMNDMMKL
jgi:4-hydroxy-tetrahydrodipicolinate reductase